MITGGSLCLGSWTTVSIITENDKTQPKKDKFLTKKYIKHYLEKKYFQYTLLRNTPNCRFYFKIPFWK